MSIPPALRFRRSLGFSLIAALVVCIPLNLVSDVSFTRAHPDSTIYVGTVHRNTSRGGSIAEWLIRHMVRGHLEHPDGIPEDEAMRMVANGQLSAGAGEKAASRYDAVESVRRAVRLVSEKCGAPAPSVELAPDVVGSSGGLSYYLASLDAATEGAISRGRKIAASAHLASDGRLLEVQKLGEKIPAAAHAGMDVFIVSADVYEFAAKVGADAGIDVWGVANVDEAVQILAPDLVECQHGA